MNLLRKKNSNPLNQKTDAQLVIDYKESLNPEIIGEIYARYHHIVFGVCLKYTKNEMLSQDALLDVFKNLFEQLVKYKIDDFKSWLLTVTRNHCLKIIKDEAKTTSIDYETNKNLSIDFMESEHEIDLLNKKEKQYNELEIALTKLKPEQKKCVSLFYIDDKSYQEISDETGFPIKKVKSYIQNGKRNLQILMTES